MQYYETLHYALNGVTTESSHHKTILSVYATNHLENDIVEIPKFLHDLGLPWSFE